MVACGNSWKVNSMTAVGPNIVVRVMLFEVVTACSHTLFEWEGASSGSTGHYEYSVEDVAEQVHLHCHNNGRGYGHGTWLDAYCDVYNEKLTHLRTSAGK